MNKRIDVANWINRIADFIELGVSATVIVSILLLLVRMVCDLGAITLEGTAFDINQFLSRAFSLVIGVEFTRMLCRHTPDTIIEVLMFATARQLIIAHSSVIDTLIGIVSIAILFLIRKYILPDLPNAGHHFFIESMWKKLTKNGSPAEQGSHSMKHMD